MMSLREVLKMVLPMVVTVVLADMVDGFPDQTIILVVWLVRWLRW
jgi:hypothetical protein